MSTSPEGDAVVTPRRRSRHLHALLDSLVPGLGHLAAALDVPTISLYGPTLPGRVGAYGRSQVHLCASGPHAGLGDRDQACFDDLLPERVVGELQALLPVPPRLSEDRV